MKVTPNNLAEKERAFFNWFDEDGSTSISRDEFKAKADRLKMTTKNAGILFQFFDKNNDGQISTEEFTTEMNKLYEEHSNKKAKTNDAFDSDAF